MRDPVPPPTHLSSEVRSAAAVAEAGPASIARTAPKVLRESTELLGTSGVADAEEEAAARIFPGPTLSARAGDTRYQGQREDEGRSENWG